MADVKLVVFPSLRAAIATHEKEGKGLRYRFGRGKELGKRGLGSAAGSGRSATWWNCRPSLRSDDQSDVFWRSSEVATRRLADFGTELAQKLEQKGPGYPDQAGALVADPNLTAAELGGGRGGSDLAGHHPIFNTGNRPEIIISKGGNR